MPANNDDNTTIGALRTLVAEFVDERDWRQFHDPKNLSMSIAIEAAELMEHFQWLRSDQLGEITDKPEAMREVREELADILAYALALANRLDLDLTGALVDKMDKNARKYPAEQYRGRFR